MEQLQLIHERLERDDSVLAFRHALIQDAAYSTLVRSRRRELHVSAARAIERLATDEDQDTAAVLAHHYSEAELPFEAVGFLVTLADRAIGAYALEDAEANLRKAALLADLVEDPGRSTEPRWRVRVRLAQILYMRGRFQESIDLLESDLAALLSGNAPALSAPCLFWLGHMYVRRSRYDDAERVANAALQQAVALGDEATSGKALGVLCLRACLKGDSSDAREAGSRSIELLERSGETHWLAMSRFYLGMFQVQVGEHRMAAQDGAVVADIGHTLGDPRLQSYGYFLRAWALADAGDSAALKEAECAVAIAPDPTSRAYSSGFLAYARLRSGNAAQAQVELEAAVRAMEQIGFRPFESLFLAYLSEAQRELGDARQARATAERAVEAAGRWSYPLGEAWARRALGRAEAQLDSPVQAEKSLAAAQAVFRTIGAVREIRG